MRFHLKVRHYEVDEYGHVNHASYVHYLETARVEALEAAGLSLREMRREGLIIVAAELFVKYHSPAGPGDTLEVSTRIREVRGARTLWAQEILEVTGERLVVSAAITGAFMTEMGKPVRVPESFRQRLSTLLVPDGEGAGERVGCGRPGTRPGRRPSP
jgi:acyl-CoA thioester hydrolase